MTNSDGDERETEHGFEAFLQGADGEELRLVMVTPDPQDTEARYDFCIELPRFNFPIVWDATTWVRIIKRRK